MKQDLATWKFRTQNLMITYTLTLRINLEDFSDSIYTYYILFRRLGSQKSKASNSV